MSTISPIQFSRVTFLVGAVKRADFPKTELPEVAFLGRSNVGKSTLLNGLWGRKKMAYTSKTPGKTAEINFFNVDKRFICVDLPGYGYAKVARGTQRLWQGLIPQYFEGRENLRHTFVLIDSRHAPKESDLELLCSLAEMAFPFSVVLTKKDKLTPAQFKAQEEAIVQILSLSLPNASFETFGFSIKDAASAEALRTYIQNLLA